MLPPPPGTVERWAWDLIATTSLGEKLDPPSAPDLWELRPAARRMTAPGRPSPFRVAEKAEKTRGLSSANGRARAFHTFLHHELQAAELMGWALLAFPEAPQELRAGLVRIAQDEVRHMNLYATQINRLGHAVGDFTVRDWFWARVPACVDVTSFIAAMGLGFESANLDHASSFAARFRTAGDEEAALVQELVGREEVAHVRFAARWFRELTGELTFDAWRRALPAPLSPLLMKGRPIQREARVRGGQPDAFVDRLVAWTEDTPGS